MRFLGVLWNDIRYQMKYGFYFLYTFISAIYVAILFLCPEQYKRLVASIIILTDPAMLGMFFIGGVWLLEKEEGLHGFWRVSPLRPMEYVLSKATSLAVISTISANAIICIGLNETINYAVLSMSVFTGSFIFTTIGLMVASYARSVNQYMLIASPPAILLSVPPILAAFGFSHPILDVTPGTVLWRIIGFSIGMDSRHDIWLWIILALWIELALLLAGIRIPIALQMEGGEE